MKKMENNQLEQLANDILNNNGKKPNLTNRDFYNSVLIFQNAVMDKMWDLQNSEKMDLNTRGFMANNCGQAIHKLVKIYTDLDLKNIEDFL